MIFCGPYPADRVFYTLGGQVVSHTIKAVYGIQIGRVFFGWIIRE